MVQEKIINVSCAFSEEETISLFFSFYIFGASSLKSVSEIQCKKIVSRGRGKKNWKVSISFLFLYIFFVVQHLNWGVLWSNNKINLIYSHFAMLIVTMMMMVKVHSRHLYSSLKGIIEKFSNVIFMFFSPRMGIFSISQFYVKNEYATSNQDTKKAKKNVAEQQRGGMKARDLDLAQ